MRATSNYPQRGGWRDSRAMDQKLERHEPTPAEVVRRNVETLLSSDPKERSLNKVLVEAKVNRSYFSNIKARNHNPKVNDLDKIARELGVPLAVLFLDPDKMPELRLLLDISRRLTPEQLPILADMAAGLIAQASRLRSGGAEGADTGAEG